MTIVAWDGKTLAADRMTSYGNTPVRRDLPKVFRVRRPGDGRVFLYGACGSSADTYAYWQWLLGKCAQPTFKDLGILMVDDTRQVWVCDERLMWEPHCAQTWGIGSGVDYALGAMAAGASAREAVLIASRLCNTCGMGVDVVRFP